MPHLLFLLAASTATTTTKSKSSSSSLFFLVIIVVFAVVYIAFIRPRSKRARATQQGSTTLSVGDEVISAGGILGTVTNVIGDEIEVEVAPGVYLNFWRRAVNLRTSVRGAPQSERAAALDDEGGDDDRSGAEHSDFEHRDFDRDDPGPADETGTVDQGPDGGTRHGGSGGS